MEFGTSYHSNLALTLDRFGHIGEALRHLLFPFLNSLLTGELN